MDLSSKLEEVRYLGVGYLLLMAGCVLSAILLMRNDASSGGTSRAMA